MANVRHRARHELVNQRGGRGEGVMVATRPVGWQPPPLPHEVVQPLNDPVQAKFQPAAVEYAAMVWGSWWSSQPSRGVDLASDGDSIRWWIICVFRRALYVQIVREQPLVVGSMKQVVANPLERVIKSLTEDIARAEGKFGMNTQDRFRLQFQDIGRVRFEEAEDAAANAKDVTVIDRQRRRRVIDAD